MTKENRIKEIIEAIKAFRKALYYKPELLPEYLELQKELINLTFNDVHAENGRLRIWDVENHFEKLNEEYGHVADKELKDFKEMSKNICNAIKSEFSGGAGEFKAFRSLETLRCKHKIMKNIEFRSGDHRTEIDAIVFTEKAIFIIEVKNPHLDIYIDERGNYCRIGNTMHHDCDIGTKMNDKEYLLREALKDSGYSEAEIVSLVVFTNSNIQVENRYKYITTCFLGNLPRIIEGYEGGMIYNDSIISTMMESVSNAECKEAYPPEFDMKQYKYLFANLMATLEEAAENRAENNTCSDDEAKVTSCYTATDETNQTNEAKNNARVIPAILKSVGLLGLGIAAGFIVGRKK